MADHDPNTHEQKLKLVEEAQERMDARARMWFANPKVKDALLRSRPGDVECKEAS